MTDSFRTGNQFHGKIISIAPMLDVTYREFRVFTRLITKRSQLWTEMITAASLIHNSETHDLLLGFDEIEEELVAQLGGNDVEMMTKAAEIVSSYGYKEININVGCPSSRVSNIGCFGAALMRYPETVRDIVASIKRRVGLPVTVKTRIGVDDQVSDEFLNNFVKIVSSGGCEHFIIHARKAFLKGINPKQNRNIPPLNYPRVFRLLEEFPHLQFSLNGGVISMAQTKQLLTDNPGLKGIMIGRMAYEDPLELLEVDHLLGCNTDKCSCHLSGGNLTRESILRQYIEYIDRRGFKGESGISMLVKPIRGLYKDVVGSGVYRRTLESVSREFKQYQAAEAIQKVLYHMLDNYPEATTQPLTTNRIENSSVQI